MASKAVRRERQKREIANRQKGLVRGPLLTFHPYPRIKRESNFRHPYYVRPHFVKLDGK